MSLGVAETDMEVKPERHRLVLLAVRTQGLFLAPGNPLGVRALSDLTRPGLRFVNRPEGSGTRKDKAWLLGFRSA